MRCYVHWGRPSKRFDPAALFQQDRRSKIAEKECEVPAVSIQRLYSCKAGSVNSQDIYDVPRGFASLICSRWPGGVNPRQ
ncbi:hypothetical protein Q3G72_033697 [Acer saccharum]|nr:hypothetical protein Q3G72_033697 [Acer saccharum]